MEYFKTYLDLNIKQRKSGSLQKAVSNYLAVQDSGDKIYGPNTIVDKELDLFYGLSILASEGVNKNSDTFLRDILINIFKTPRHKFVDWEHDVQALDKKANPDRYKVIGHIYDSCLATQEGFHIPEYDVFKAMDGKWFPEDSQWRDKALDIIVAWVIYKFEFPEIVDKILKYAEENPDTFGVSMEILFSDYKFRIGGAVDPAESFDFDANSIGIKEVCKGEPLADILQKDWAIGKNRTYNGLPVIRILGGNIFFSGMAITENRANKRSWNISLAKDISKEFKSQDLIDLVEAVAKRSNIDMSTCNIVNGEPDCECLEKAISAEVEAFEAALSELEIAISAAKKKKGVKVPGDKSTKTKANFDCPYCSDENDDESEDHYGYHINDLENNLVRAQKKIEDLYKNNIDGDLSQEELKEEVEEIYSILESSQIHIDFIKS